MKKTNLVIGLLILLVLADSVAAFSFGDIFKNLRDIWARIFNLEDRVDKIESTPTTTIHCPSPYILVGSECCLDKDGNQVCDKDETTTTQKQTTTTQKQTTTTEKQTTTTAKPTTTVKKTTTTTTTLPKIACYEQSDCGETVTKKVCFNNDVYEQSTIPLCKNAGTPEAECINKLSSFMRGTQMKAPYEDCGSKNCYDGECVNKVPDTTTTVAGQTTTTLSGQTTTTVAGSTTSITLSTSTIPSPVCGDGILSWHGANPAGSEECDGGNYPCPAGLTCQDCKCVGCGNGKKESGEECDPFTKRTRVNGSDLWQGQSYGCSGQYESCDMNCECTSNVVCSPSPPFYNTDNCDNSCNNNCETCEQEGGTPCYKCQADCSKLGSGWGTSSICATCDSQHEECQKHAECDDCYHCVTVCPQDTDGVDYYRYQGCDATCDSRLCRQVKLAQPQSQYKECYRCYDPVCGDDIVSPPDEDCEYDSDCPDYHYCDMDCLCMPDCNKYCADQGVNGYAYFAAAATKAQCQTEAKNRMNALSAQCRAVCSAHSFMTGVNDVCCCVDANWKPCANCPGQNPDCTQALADCKASL